MKPARMAMCCQDCLGSGVRVLYGLASQDQVREHSRVPCEFCGGTGEHDPEGHTIPGGLYDLPEPEITNNRRAR